MSGPKVWKYFPQWKSCFSFAFHGVLKYHQNSLKPDIWYTAELFKDQEQKQPTMKVIPKSYVNRVTFSNKKSNTAKNCGLSKLGQFNDSCTLSIYCLRRVGPEEWMGGASCGCYCVQVLKIGRIFPLSNLHKRGKKRCTFTSTEAL